MSQLILDAKSSRCRHSPNAAVINCSACGRSWIDPNTAREQMGLSFEIEFQHMRDRIAELEAKEASVKGAWNTSLELAAVAVLKCHTREEVAETILALKKGDGA